MTKTLFIILAISAFLTPLYPFFIIAGMAIVMDTYYGFKLARQEGKNRSRKFMRFLWKFFLYDVIIFSGYVIDKYLIGVFIDVHSHVELTFTRAITFGIFINELISVDEKKIAINGKGFRYYYKRIMGVVKFLNNERKDIIS